MLWEALKRKRGRSKLNRDDVILGDFIGIGCGIEEQQDGEK